MEGHQAIKSKAVNQYKYTCCMPYPITEPNTTRIGLLSPNELFNTYPTGALYATKQGMLMNAESVKCELLILSEQYNWWASITPRMGQTWSGWLGCIQDILTSRAWPSGCFVKPLGQVCAQRYLAYNWIGFADVLLRHLQASGWTVVYKLPYRRVRAWSSL